jgi:lipopolysaccharide biosynthesis protein
MVNPAARLIAFYLPQFHPIPENDEWWGKGFTEWTNVAKAKPFFPGHYQPHIPADLGFYDLRVPETRLAQAEMARQHGIEGFCYYHYWFAGKRLLERPFNEVLKSREPSLPFCLCWANETWSGKWHGCPDRVLIEQTYPGPEDDAQHFAVLAEAFADDRYLKVDDKPLLVVFSPKGLPEPRRTTDLWRDLARRRGFPGLHLVGVGNAPWSPGESGFDAATPENLPRAKWVDGESGRTRPLKRSLRRMLHYPLEVYPYEKAIRYFLVPEGADARVYPCVIPNWDNTPRCGLAGRVLHKSTPKLFRRHLRATLDQVAHKPLDHRIVFIKSWNEWAEGNYLEPDLKYGYGYLEAIRSELNGLG